MAKDQSTPASSHPHGLSETLTPGVRVGGARYILRRILGRGSLTVVWLARDFKLEQEVALKVLPEPLCLM
jgi:serine/threonine protein kinase